MSMLVPTSANHDDTTPPDTGRWSTVDASVPSSRFGGSPGKGEKKDDGPPIAESLQAKLAKDFADPGAKKFSLAELQGARPESVNPAYKERYLADAEFESVFKLTPAAFAKLPQWKQTNKKKEMQLF